MSEENSSTEDTNEEQDAPQIVDAAFLVFAQDGVGYALPVRRAVVTDPAGTVTDFDPMRLATPDDMYRYSHEVAKDVNVATTATAVVRQMAEYTARLQSSLRDQALASQIQQQGGLHVPGR